MMKYNTLSLDQRGNVGLITLNRPKALNALSSELMDELTDALEEALDKAMVMWEGDSFRNQGEKNDPYNLVCWDNIDFPTKLFMELAETVFLPALEQREKYPGRSLQPESPKP